VSTLKLDEALWRAFDGSVRATPLSKHLGSAHDQKTHGRRKTAARWTKEELAAGDVSLYKDGYRFISDRYKHAKSAVQRLTSREGVPDLEASVSELRELNSRPYGGFRLAHWRDSGTAEEQLTGFLENLMSDWGDSGSAPFFEALAAEALEDWYGLDLGERWYGVDSKEVAEETLSVMSDDLRLFMKHLAASVYDVTQDHLAELGVERVRLWRGIMAEKQSVPSSVRTALERESDDTKPVLVQADVAESPLSSWTSALYQAKRFARQDMLSTTDVKWYNAYSLILHDLVPAKYIYSVGGYGFGERRESEVVVVGSKHKVDVLDAYGVGIFTDDVDELLTGGNPEESGVGKAEEVILIDKDERNRNWLRPNVSKHLGTQHDQKSHGSWSYKSKRGMWTVTDSSKNPGSVKDLEFDDYDAWEIASRSIFNVELDHPYIGRVVAEVREVEPDPYAFGKIRIFGRIVLPDGWTTQLASQDTLEIAPGGAYGQFDRSIDPAKGNVTNNIFKLGEALQGTGLGTTLSLHWEDQLNRAGIDYMRTEAVSDLHGGLNGGYTWLKYGYKPDSGVGRDLIEAWYSSNTNNPGFIDNFLEEHLRPVAEAFDISDDLEFLIEESSNNVDDPEVRRRFARLVTETSTDSAEPLLRLAAEDESFRDYLMSSARWYGSKSTERLEDDVAKAQKTVAQVLREWNIKNPAAVENDDPEFWQAVRNAFGNVSKHLPSGHDQLTHGRRKTAGDGEARIVDLLSDRRISETLAGMKNPLDCKGRCIQAENFLNKSVSELRPDWGYRSVYVRGAKPGVIAEEQYPKLDDAFTGDPVRIARDQTHVYGQIKVPVPDRETGGIAYEVWEVDYTYRQFQPDSEWPVITFVGSQPEREGWPDEGEFERWDEVQFFNER